jgi:hypothetical protein
MFPANLPLTTRIARKSDWQPQVSERAVADYQNQECNQWVSLA